MVKYRDGTITGTLMWRQQTTVPSFVVMFKYKRDRKHGEFSHCLSELSTSSYLAFVEQFRRILQECPT